jgi:hypothetical protein
LPTWDTAFRAAFAPIAKEDRHGRGAGRGGARSLVAAVQKIKRAKWPLDELLKA